MPYGPRMTEGQLRWMARSRIADGRLPGLFPHLISPRHGSDTMCQLCDQLIDRYRVEYQITDPRDGYGLAFHLMCYKLWQLECDGLGSAA